MSKLGKELKSHLGFVILKKIQNVLLYTTARPDMTRMITGFKSRTYFVWPI